MLEMNNVNHSKPSEPQLNFILTTFRASGPGKPRIEVLNWDFGRNEWDKQSSFDDLLLVVVSLRTPLRVLLSQQPGKTEK